MDFEVDVQPDDGLLEGKKGYVINNVDDDDDDPVLRYIPPYPDFPDKFPSFEELLKKRGEKSSSVDLLMKNIEIGPEELLKTNEPSSVDTLMNKNLIGREELLKEKKKEPSRVDLLMKKSIIGPDFEQLKVVPTPNASRRTQRLERKREREKTKGPGWFNLPAQEVTEEVKNDLDLLKMRSVLDPKHFYKNNDLTHTPKYFQVGTVVETAADYYNGRIPKSQRKRTLVDELLADAEAQTYQKKKFKSIVSQGHGKGHKSHKHKKNKSK